LPLFDVPKGLNSTNAAARMITAAAEYLVILLSMINLQIVGPNRNAFGRLCEEFVKAVPASVNIRSSVARPALACAFPTIFSISLEDFIRAFPYNKVLSFSMP
jgi:hypothetical protein